MHFLLKQYAIGRIRKNRELRRLYMDPEVIAIIKAKRLPKLVRTRPPTRGRHTS